MYTQNLPAMPAMHPQFHPGMVPFLQQVHFVPTHGAPAPIPYQASPIVYVPYPVNSIPAMSYTNIVLPQMPQPPTPVPLQQPQMQMYYPCPPANSHIPPVTPEMLYERELQERTVQDRLISACLNKEKATQERAFKERQLAENGFVVEKKPSNVPDIGDLEFGDCYPFSFRAPDDYDDYNELFEDETEEFIHFLDAGCEVAEKIAIRNQHRPCFRKIYELCFRTRSEINKPHATSGNIHSQGIPWATKDFIFAYIRLINCWHLIKGYLQATDSSLGNIERELTGEFRSCYDVWETNTRELCEHLIRIFANLDSNLSNPAPLPAFLLRHRAKRRGQPPSTQTPETSKTSTTSSPSSNILNPEVKEFKPLCPMNQNLLRQNLIVEPTDTNATVSEILNTTGNLPPFDNFYSNHNNENVDEAWENRMNNSDNYAIHTEETSESENSSIQNWQSFFSNDDHSNENFNLSYIHSSEENELLTAQLAFEQQLLHEQIQQQIALNQLLLQPLHDFSLDDLDIDVNEEPIPHVEPIGPPVFWKSESEQEFDIMKTLLIEIGKTEFFASLDAHEYNFNCKDALKVIMRNYAHNIYQKAEEMAADIDKISDTALNYFKDDPIMLRQVEKFVSVVKAYRPQNVLDLQFEDNGWYSDEVIPPPGINLKPS